MDKLLTMSNREITRLEAMSRIKDKRLTQKKAARMLNLSVRQVKLLYRAHKEHGAKGLISAQRGKRSNNRLEAGVEQLVLDQLEGKYEDFGSTVADEKKAKVHSIRISRENMRKQMIVEGLWNPKRAKKPSSQQMSERLARFGDLMQIDGSDHS